MDVWTDKQLALMRLGGNQRCNDFFRDHGLVYDYETQPIAEKYDTPQAELYKLVLLAQYENKPIPTVLPPKRTRVERLVPTGSTSALQGGGRQEPLRQKMEGFGSAPMPSTHDSSSTFVTAAAYGAVVVVAAGVYWYFTA
jgi:hypothetical protein